VRGTSASSHDDLARALSGPPRGPLHPTPRHLGCGDGRVHARRGAEGIRDVGGGGGSGEVSACLSLRRSGHLHLNGSRGSLPRWSPTRRSSSSFSQSSSEARRFTSPSSSTGSKRFMRGETCGIGEWAYTTLSTGSSISCPSPAPLSPRT